MPRYDYRCSKCGHEEERVTSFAKRDEQVCDRATPGHELNGVAVDVRCGAPMQRADGVPLTASTPYAWRP